MVDLSCKYLGMELKSPVIAASSGFTDSVSKIIQLEKHGVGAVVLKSIFEEEISLEYDKAIRDEQEKTGREEFLDYLDVRIRAENLDKYIQLIRQAKNEVSIPVIASVNCTTAMEWTSFTKEMENAGADAIELNVFILPSSLDKNETTHEERYFDIVEAVQKHVKVPIVLKISYYFTNLAKFIYKLSHTGISGLVLFNRFYSPDFDIDKLEVVPSNVLSTAGEITMPLRWIAMMSGRLGCDLSASTGVADGKSAIKLLLAGADTVQVASALYRHGIAYMDVIHNEIQEWMEQQAFNQIAEFKGRLSQTKVENPALFERVQFMKYFSDKESLI